MNKWYIKQTMQWLIGLLALVWVGVGQGLGQVMGQDNVQGEAIYRQVRQALLQTDSLVDNQLVHTRYQAISFFRTEPEGPLHQSDTQMDVYVGKDKLYYSGPEVTCVQDKKQTVSIFPDSKRILVGKTNSAIRKASIEGQWRKVLLDSLLSCASITECKSETLEGQTVYKLVFSVLPQRQIRLGMRQMSLWVDAESKITRQMEVLYPAGSAIEKTRMSFSAPRLIAMDSAPVPVSASALVWDNKGKLLPAWKGYEIVHTNK